MIFYENIFRDFYNRKVQYLIVGGIAVNLLGSMRSTADLDILADMSESNLKLILGVLKNNNYRCRLPINPSDILSETNRTNWIENKNLKAISFFKTNDIKEIDIILESPVSFQSALPNKIEKMIDNISIPVIGIDDLITMKRYANRQIDLIDIRELEKIRDIQEQKNV